MEISQEVIRALLDAFDKSDWQEMTVSIGNDRLHVSRNGGAAPPAAAPMQQGAGEQRAEVAAPAPPPEPQPESRVTSHESPLPEGTVVESPSVGLFWRAPSPGAPPFVEVGKQVSEGDTLAIVEVMKLMNHVVAPVAGEVKAIVPENGEAVEYGQALVVIG